MSHSLNVTLRCCGST